MKKRLISLLLLIATLFTFVACGEEQNSSVSNNSNQENSSQENNAPVYTVDQAGWEKALSDESFKNVTVMQLLDYNESEKIEYTQRWKVADGNGYFEGVSASSRNDEKLGRIESSVDAYYFTENGNKYKTKLITTTYANGQEEETVTTEQLTSDDYYYDESWALLECTGFIEIDYSEFKYDETEKCYINTDDNTTYKVFFENGKLIEVHYIYKWDFITKTYFFDYGTTEITIPKAK